MAQDVLHRVTRAESHALGDLNNLNTAGVVIVMRRVIHHVYGHLRTAAGEYLTIQSFRVLSSMPSENLPYGSTIIHWSSSLRTAIASPSGETAVVPGTIASNNLIPFVSACVCRVDQ